MHVTTDSGLGSDHLILWSGVERCLRAWKVFFFRDAICLLFASLTKRTSVIAFTPVLDIFFWQNRVLDFFPRKLFPRPPRTTPRPPSPRPTTSKHQIVAPKIFQRTTMNNECRKRHWLKSCSLQSILIFISVTS